MKPISTDRPGPHRGRRRGDPGPAASEAMLAIADSSAHTLNNLLSSILLSSHVLRAEKNGERIGEMLDNVEQATVEARRVLHELSHCLHGSGADAKLPVRRLVEAVSHTARERLANACHVTTHYEVPLPPVTGVMPHAFDLLLDLLLESSRVLPSGSQMSLAARPRALGVDETAPSGVEVLLSHPPYSEPHIGQALPDPLTGLTAVAMTHGFHLTPTHRDGALGGWKLALPAADATPAAPKVERRKLPSGRGQLLLLVDDDEIVRRTVGETLRLFGYRVVTASNGLQAIEIYKERAEEISVLVTDLQMPGLGGIATIQELSRFDPELRTVVITGVVEQRVRAENLALTSVLGVVPKPIEASELLRCVARAAAA